MGLFDLFTKKEKKIVKAPIECRIGDLLEIERQLVAKNVWLDVLVFQYQGDVHRIGQMFQDGNMLMVNGDKKRPAYVYDTTLYETLEDLVSGSVLCNENESITLLGYGSDEYNDAIDNVVEEDFYLDGKGEYWKLVGEIID